MSPLRRNSWGLNILICAVLTAIGVFADWITKQLAVINLKGNTAVPVIPWFIEFTYVENKGAAWGMLADARWVFISVSLIAIGAIIVYAVWKKPTDFLLCSSLVLVLAGGIGNMIDRLSLGYVVDFLNFTFIDFPVFNVADSFVCIGAALLILYLVISTIKDSKNAKKAKNDAGDEIFGDRENADDPGDGGDEA